MLYSTLLCNGPCLVAKIVKHGGDELRNVNDEHVEMSPASSAARRKKAILQTVGDALYMPYALNRHCYVKNLIHISRTIIITLPFF